jgi:hypothetical protein
MSYSL